MSTEYPLLYAEILKDTLQEDSLRARILFINVKSQCLVQRFKGTATAFFVKADIHFLCGDSTEV